MAVCNEEEFMSALQEVWQYHLMGHTVAPSDCIFVLCSNDLRVAEYAATLYAQGLAPIVLVSGGTGRFTEGFDKPEAEVFADIMKARGVPDTALLLETTATNTGENVTKSFTLMTSSGYNFKRFILVQKPFMERRTYATFMKQWPDATSVADVRVTSPPIPLSDYATTEFPLAKVAEAVLSDFERIVSYAKRGFQTPQDIPDTAQRAYEVAKMYYNAVLAQVKATNCSSPS
eukprot:m.31497 g.31497  ORF g.31497 m.31497 type:complete len:231 (+) comp9423_c0_seq1:183-875(+)